MESSLTAAKTAVELSGLTSNTMEEASAAEECSAATAEAALAEINLQGKDVKETEISDNSIEDCEQIKDAEENNVENNMRETKDDQYTRQFLLSLHTHPLALQRPCQIPDEKIVRKKVNNEAIEMVDILVNKIKI